MKLTRLRVLDGEIGVIAPFRAPWIRGSVFTFRGLRATAVVDRDPSFSPLSRKEFPLRNSESAGTKPRLDSVALTL